MLNGNDRNNLILFIGKCNPILVQFSEICFNKFNLIKVQYQKHGAGYLNYNHNGDIIDQLLKFNKRVQNYFTHMVCTIVSYKIKDINISNL